MQIWNKPLNFFFTAKVPERLTANFELPLDR
jgi:hypothetical protein